MGEWGDTVHGDALGFAPGDLDDLVGQILEDEPAATSDTGATWIWGTTSRAALVVHADTDGQVVHVSPFLAPQTRQQVRFLGMAPNENDPHASVVLAEVETVAGTSRIGFGTAHAVLWASTLEAGVRIETGVAALVESVDKPARGAAVQPDIAATGLDAVGEPVPTAHVSGIIEQHLLRHNDLTKRPFEWAVIGAGGFRIEVVAAPSALRVPFRTGEGFSATVHLCGPIWRELD